MIEFLKKYGFPRDIIVETEEYENRKEGFKGYKSKIINSRGKVIREFQHKDMRARVHWVDGYFTALKKKNEKEFMKIIIMEIKINLKVIECWTRA